MVRALRETEDEGGEHATLHSFAFIRSSFPSDLRRRPNVSTHQ